MSVIITVTRTDIVGNAQMGTFAADSVTGYTLERNDKKIDTGSYDAELYDSPKFERKVILLKGVSGRKTIEIHHGNYVVNTTGCILVGKGKGNVSADGDGTITDSVLMLDELLALCQGKNIKVNIKND